jgi:hypothetical protein
MALEQFEHRVVGIPTGILDDRVKIADRLVVVENEDEPNGGRHAGIIPASGAELIDAVVSPSL